MLRLTAPSTFRLGRGPIRTCPPDSSGIRRETAVTTRFELEVVRRLAQGLQFRAGYTWAKNLDMNSALTGAQANNQAQMVLDRNDPRRDWGRSALNVTNQGSISAHYEFPFGRNKQGPRSAGRSGQPADQWLASQWNRHVAEWIPIHSSGRFERLRRRDTRNPDRPEVNPAFSGPILLRKPAQWFSPNAFSLPAAGTYGSLGRGTLNGPGLADVDVSLAKDSAVSEKIKVQLRAEFFNVLNRANFDLPIRSCSRVAPSAPRRDSSPPPPRRPGKSSSD